MKIKRILKELEELEKEKDDYIISYDSSDITKINVIIKCPNDSLYKHKFVKIQITLDENYPYKPPQVHFFNYKNTRIHQNLYGCGKVCLSILGTWSGEQWCHNANGNNYSSNSIDT